MADDINALLNDLDMQMLSDFNEYKNLIMSTWEGFVGNEGQMSLVRDHILPTCQDHIGEAHEEWPINVGPDELQDAIYGSYDPEVIDRAFSETLGTLMDELTSIFDDAGEAMSQHTEALFGVVAAHSTNPPWTL